MLALLLVLPNASCAHADDAIETLALAIAVSLDPRVAEVLPRIDGAGGKLLALRSYLRSRERLAERWSWSQAQIIAYEGSVEQLALNAELQRVREAFERANPGFELFVNPQVRSLDIQLANWNRNESVAAASARLLHDANASLGPAVADVARGAPMLEALLMEHTPDPIPTVAAPGLSPHGQMRAIDFQVHRGDEVVAGPDTRTMGPVWEQGGWAGRIDRAVRDGSHRFVGPLVSPREPWHYTYVPDAIASQ